MKYNRLLTLLLIVLVAFGAVACQAATPHEFAGATYPEPLEVPDFTLMSTNGPVSLSDFEDQYVFVYFGYTFCPDVCPATLAELSRVTEQLGDDADRIQVLMVTVDPERDSPERLEQYTTHFNPSFIGLAGTTEEIDAAGAPFGLYYARNEGSAESGYLVDHTARAFLVDTDGRAVVAYPYQARADAIVADLRYLFEEGG